MKNFFYALLFISTAVLTSCSSDDDSDGGLPSLDNTITFNEETFNVTTSRVDDYGTETQNTGFYNVDFILSGLTEDGEQFQFYVETFSAGTSFDEGTFAFQDGSDISNAPDQFFNNFIFSSNATLTVGADRYFATQGTLTINDESPSFSLEAQLATEDGTEINVEYSGEFEVNIIRL